MDFSSVTLHPEFPKKVWIIVEQPRNEPDRYAYDSGSKSFYRRSYTAVAYARGFSGVYGWVGGSGIPPEPHHDVFCLPTNRHLSVIFSQGIFVVFLFDRIMTINLSQSMMRLEASWLQQICRPCKKISMLKCYGYIPE